MYALDGFSAPASVPAFVGFDSAEMPLSGDTAGPVSVSRLVKSVVEEAGLGRFVYLKGRSGRRYIFSCVRAEQVDLYRRALFAVTSVDGDVKVLKDVSRVRPGTSLYVHLLDDAENFTDVLADLEKDAA